MRQRAALLLLAGGLIGSVLALSPANLIAHLRGDRLHISALNLHFLSGKALDRLHEGATIPYAFRLTLSANPNSVPLQQSLDRFLISYDLWAENFKVEQMFGERKIVANLTPNAAENWCLNQMWAPSTGLPSDIDLWMRLQIRAEDPVPRSPVSDAGFRLSSLIELFVKPAPAQEWNAGTAPFRLTNLRQ